ncbi:MAG: MotA/TolQ/ExbB proton channel family protein [Bradymonadaceae bacterium]
MSVVDLYELLTKGGWLMLPVAACSVAGLAFFLERLWSLRRSRILPAEFADRVLDRIAEGELDEAAGLCAGSESPLARMIEAGLEHASEPRDIVKEAVAEEGQRQVFYMERFVNALGAIATISPLLGLLGTVVGMIQVFRDVVAQTSGGGAVQAGALAGGIWQALITTAAGLTVAIPVYLGYRYILGRIDRYAVDLEERALKAVDGLAADSGETAADAPAPEASDGGASAEKEAA